MAFKGAHIQPSCHAAVNPSQTICANEPGIEACANCPEAGERLFTGRVCMLPGRAWLQSRSWGVRVSAGCPGIGRGPGPARVVVIASRRPETRPPVDACPAVRADRVEPLGLELGPNSMLTTDSDIVIRALCAIRFNYCLTCQRGFTRRAQGCGRKTYAERILAVPRNARRNSSLVGGAGEPGYRNHGAPGTTRGGKISRVSAG